MLYRLWAVFVLAAALCLILWPESASAIPSRSPPIKDDNPAFNFPQTPQWVYRGHKLAPLDVEKVPGMPPKLDLNNAPEPSDSRHDPFSLLGHDDDAIDPGLGRKHTAFVSTSMSPHVAVDFAISKARIGQGWVYRLRPTKNMVDMNKSTSNGGMSYEEEYSALGGIRMEQIYDGIRIPADFQKHRKLVYKNWDDLVEHVAAYWMANPVQDGSPTGYWKNPKYDHAYDAVPEIKGHPLLAGLRIPEARPLPTDESQWDGQWQWEPYNSVKIQDRMTAREYAQKFLVDIGEPQGWLKDYPLFKAPETTPSPNEEAKQKETEESMKKEPETLKLVEQARKKKKERDEAMKKEDEAKKKKKEEEDTKNAEEAEAKAEAQKQANQKAVDSANKLRDSSDTGSWIGNVIGGVAAGIGTLGGAAFATSFATGGTAASGATAGGIAAAGGGLALLTASESVSITLPEVAQVVAEFNPQLANEMLIDLAPAPPTTPPGSVPEPPLLGKRDHMLNDMIVREVSTLWVFHASGPTLARALKQACRVSIERARVKMTI